MSAKKSNTTKDQGAEAKIKEAARTVFHKKGFDATRTRDIAEAAGINLALLNYYFRSKNKLFEIIMMETMMQFMQGMVSVFKDEATSLEEKIELVAIRYTDLMIADPEIPLFILSEIRSNVDNFFDNIPLAKVLMNSVFIEQYKAAIQAGEAKDVSPLHFIINLMSLTVFPFAASPMLKKVGGLKDKQFEQLMQERKKLIPIWIKASLQP